MTFKKTLSKNFKEKESLNILRVSSAKTTFFLSALFFFLNIFLIGADKNENLPILLSTLPLTYIIFISSMLFFLMIMSSTILSKKSKILSIIVNIVLILIFALPLVAFYLEKDFIKNLINI